MVSSHALASPKNTKRKRYSPYKKLKVFAEVLSSIENRYVDPVNDQALIYGAIKGIAESLDPHSSFMTPKQYQRLRDDTSGEFGGLGIEVMIRNGYLTVISPIKDTPAEKAGIQKGDRIIEIAGKDAKGIDLEKAIDIMRGKIGTKIKIKIQRKNKTIPFELIRAKIKMKSVVFNPLGNGIYHLRIKIFIKDVHKKLRAVLKSCEKKSCKGIVLDLRNNPGGLLDQAIRVSDLFLKKGIIVKTIGQHHKVVSVEKASRIGSYDKIPVVCLINSNSASAAEIVAGALQDHKRAVIIGERSFGKGSVQTLIRLSDGSAFKLTVARYYTPNDRSIQEFGILPDIVVAEKAPKEKIKKETLKREKDLKGHLRNDRQDNATKAPKRLEDFQLQTAIDLLNAASIINRQ